MTISRNLSFLAEGVSSTGVLGATYGGTGQSSITTGDLLYGSASNTISKLAIGSTGTILRVVAGVPSWGTDYTGTVTSVAATVPSFLSISGSPITSSGTLAITYSGTALPVANGGTGLTSLTTGQVLYGSFSQSANLYFSGTQLGVGTSSPNAVVHAYSSTTNAGRITIQGTGSTAGNYRGINLYNASGFSGGIFQDEATNALSFWNSAAPLMTLDNSGNLGIGVTPSAWVLGGYKALEVNSAGNGIYSGLGDTLLTCNAYYSSGWKYASTGVNSSFYEQNSGNHIWKTAPTGTVGNAITFTEAMRIHASGGVSIGNTTDPGASILYVSSGVRFPATQVASSDVNTLDDYEEGTFTPTISSGITSPTYTEQLGRYTKIGNLVYAQIRFLFSGGTGSGAQIIASGLPFASNANTPNGAGCNGYCDATTTNINWYVPQSSSTNVFGYLSGGTNAILAGAMSGKYIVFNVTYET